MPVTIILGRQSRETLIAELRQGEAGIRRVQRALLHVDAENAQAYLPEDEKEVKRMISESQGGFAAVNQKVVDSLAEWMGQTTSSFMKSLVKESQTSKVKTRQSFTDLALRQTS